MGPFGGGFSAIGQRLARAAATARRSASPRATRKPRDVLILSNGLCGSGRRARASEGAGVLRTTPGDGEAPARTWMMSCSTEAASPKGRTIRRATPSLDPGGTWMRTARPSTGARRAPLLPQPSQPPPSHRSQVILAGTVSSSSDPWASQAAGTSMPTRPRGPADVLRASGSTIWPSAFRSTPDPCLTRAGLPRGTRGGSRRSFPDPEPTWAARFWRAWPAGP